MEIVNEPLYPDAYSIEAIGGILTVIGLIASGPLGLLAVVLVQPQPPWNGPILLVESFHRIQTLRFYFGYLLAVGSILMLVSVCVISKWRAISMAALIFTSIGAAFAISNYLVQTTFIPAAVGDYTPELGPALTTLSIANPRSLAWAMEMWAYGLIGLGT